MNQVENQNKRKHEEVETSYHVYDSKRVKVHTKDLERIKTMKPLTKDFLFKGFFLFIIFLLVLFFIFFLVLFLFFSTSFFLENKKKKKFTLSTTMKTTQPSL